MENCQVVIQHKDLIHSHSGCINSQFDERLLDNTPLTIASKSAADSCALGI